MSKKDQPTLNDLQMLDSRGVARLLAVSYDTVCKWRQHHIGPRYHTVPGPDGKRTMVRYYLKDVQEFQAREFLVVDPARPVRSRQ